MNPGLRVAIADDERDMRDFLQEALADLGHQVVVVAGTGAELVQGCCRQPVDLIITDIKMPDLDGIEAARQIGREGPVPVILVSAYHDAELIRRAEEEHILAYLIKPIKTADLEPAIAIAMRRFHQFQELRRQAADLAQALADRKIIERAKGILMKAAGLDEAAAFRRLQKLASDNNKKLVEVAHMIVLTEEATRPEKPRTERTRE
jgi:response regulator NasT